MSSDESPAAGPRAARATWVLRLVGVDGSSWLEGTFESPGEARARATMCARASPMIIGGSIWKYRFGQAVSMEQLHLRGEDTTGVPEP